MTVLIKNGDTSKVIKWFMRDSVDHRTGKTGLTVAVTLSKNGAAFGAAAGTVAEIANGWYKLTPAAGDVAINGIIALHATAAGADPTDDSYEVIVADLFTDIPTAVGQRVSQRQQLTVGGRIIVPNGLHAFITKVVNAAGTPVTGLLITDFAFQFIQDNSAIHVGVPYSFSERGGGYYIHFFDMANLLSVGGYDNYTLTLACAIHDRTWNFNFDLLPQISAPTVQAIRSEMDANSTRLAHLQADLTSTPPSAAAIRTELDANSTMPGKVWDAARGAHATAGTMGETAQDKYQALVLLLVDRVASVDRYTISFFKNGELVTSGVTVPTIKILKAADGTSLVPQTAASVIAATAQYKYVEAVNRVVKGAAYVAVVTATIGGVAMSWVRPVGRDS